MSNSIFITGTGTDVGKTYVSALLVKKLKEIGLNVAYYKAAMSGNSRDKYGKLIPGDALFVKETSKIEQSIESMSPYIYERPLSPHLAARIEGNPVSMKLVEDRYNSLQSEYDYLVVEGSGGIICPIRYDEEKIFLEDIIKQLDLSCIIVADTRLGTINQTVLTCEYMKSKGIEIKGIIYNRFDEKDIMQVDNIKMCEEITNIKTLGFVRDDSDDIDLNFKALEYIFNTKI